MNVLSNAWLKWREMYTLLSKKISHNCAFNAIHHIHTTDMGSTLFH